MNTPVNTARRLIVGMSGASGAIYGIRILQALQGSGIETHLVMSESARITLAAECELTGPEVEALARYFSEQKVIPDIAFDPALADIGRYLYLNGNPHSGVTACATCHGPQAHGALFLPRLAGQHASYVERRMREFIAHARGSSEMVMHSVVDAISEAEIVAVAQYLSGLE